MCENQRVDKNVFWLRVWQSFFIAITIILMSISGCTIHKNAMITKSLLNDIPGDQTRMAYSIQVSDVEKTIYLMTKNKE